MISVAIRTMHYRNIQALPPMTLPHNHLINAMPFQRLWVLLGLLVNFSFLKVGVAKGSLVTSHHQHFLNPREH